VFCVVAVALLGTAGQSAAQIATVTNPDGRRMFVNAEPPALVKLAPANRRAAIYLPGEVSFTGRNHPAMNIDRDGAEALVREAAERHHVDPALGASGDRNGIELEPGSDVAQGGHGLDAIDSDNSTTLWSERRVQPEAECGCRGAVLEEVAGTI